MKRLWMSAWMGVWALGLNAQDPNRTLRPQQVTVQVAVKEARVALVIGNSAYAEAFLKNPVNDAREMKAALESCKFEVTLLANASKRQMEEAIATFGNRIRGGAVGLFYFAGHGLQVRGANYLIPVGARLEKESDVTYEGVDVGKVLDEMDAAKNKLNLLILDACRNNPFARSWRSADKGLAQVSAPTGSLIAYATAPGRTAADGTGEHGAYTEALLAELREPGLKAEDLFKRVRVRVTQATGDQQVPWESSSLKGDFYFRPLATVVSGPTDAQLEATVWEGVQDSRKVQDFESFLTRFPKGTFAELAKAKLTNLRRASQSLVVNNLTEPWKALQRDKLETKEEFAGRIAQLGLIRIGEVRVSVDNYDVETKQLTLPIKPDLWAKPFVKRDKLVVEVDREQMRALVNSDATAPLVARFEARGGQLLADGFSVNSKMGVLTPLHPPYVLPDSTNDILLGATSVLVDGTKAYVIAGPVFHVLDISNPMKPSLLGTVTHGFRDLRVEAHASNNNIVWCARSWSGGYGKDTYVSSIDVSNPTRPVVVGTLSFQPSLSLLAGASLVHSGFLLMHDYSRNVIYVVDVSNPAKPTLFSQWNVPNMVNGGPGCMMIEGDLLYLPCGEAGVLKIYDLTNLASVREVGSVPTGDECYGTIVKIGPFAYLTTRSMLKTIDVTNPSNPVVVGSVPFSGYLKARHGRLFSFDLSAPIIRAYSLSNPFMPVPEATSTLSFPTPSTSLLLYPLTSPAATWVGDMLIGLTYGSTPAFTGVRSLMFPVDKISR